MFKNLTNFGYKRTTTEAIGFYVAYLVLTIVLASLSGGLLGLVSGNQDSFGFGVRIGTIVAILISLLISFLIISSKKMTGNFIYLLLALVRGVLAFFGGGILGIIPAAY